MLTKIVEKISECIGAENAENLASMIERVKSRAIERNTDQSVEVIFNGKGFVRHINGSDNLTGIKPKGYQPE